MIGFLEILVNGFTWADAQVQRAVDAGMYVLMRRGFSKAAIRYVIGVAVVMGYVTSSYCGSFVDWHGFLSLVCVIFLTSALIVTVFNERFLDEKEALASMPIGRSLKFWPFRYAAWCSFFMDVGLLGGFIRAGNTFGKSPDLLHRWHIFRSTSDVLLLLYLYTMHTLPRPPARLAQWSFFRSLQIFGQDLTKG